MRKYSNLIIWFIVLVAIVVLFNTLGPQAAQPKAFTMNEFVKQVKAKQVKEATVYDTARQITGTLKNKTEFEVNYPEGYQAVDLLVKYGVKTTVERPNEWVAWAVQTLPIIIFMIVLMVILYVVMGRQMSGGSKVLSFGKSRAKMTTKDMPKTTFKDVAGLDEAVEELQEIKEFLADPKKFQSLGAKIPKGILLYGPPGTGKTLLAKAVAGEANVPFLTISGSDFVEMFVGVGASRVRDLFDQAKTNAPAIIFVDEIDAVGRMRGAGIGGGHDEREQTLNQLLVEMDGFNPNIGIIMIAATNRPDILDSALLRPGRFDRQIVTDRPDLKGREGILKVHAKDKPLAKDVDLSVVARSTPGFTGADLANLLNEGALLAARHGKKEVDMPELQEAIERVIAGPERRTRLISDREKEIIAYHETGHALVADELPYTDPVHKISIIPRGQAIGYTITLPTEDKYLVAKSELHNKLAQLLAGRVAEETVFKDVTTGAHNDLERATKIARQMVCEYGMSGRLGPMTLGQKEDMVFLGRDIATNPDYSDRVASEIDAEIRRIIVDAYNEAKHILTEKKAKMDRIARQLIKMETIEGAELDKLLGHSRQKKAAAQVVDEEKPAAVKAPVDKRTRAPIKPALEGKT
ncbi:MAG: ATP-dependent zinc metalloprotease FtsH [Actinomycetota bacterium]